MNVFHLNANNLSGVQKGTAHHASAFLNFSSIETERLIIRKFQITDVDDVFAFTSDPEMITLTPIFEHTDTKERALLYIQNIIENYRIGMPDYWAVVLKETNTVIGIVCIDISSRYRGDIGYAIARNYWARGIATEAAKAVIDFGFNVLGLKRVEGACDPRNIGSSRVLEKCGMQYEGLLKSCYCMRGEFCDRKLYAIVK